MKVTFTCPFGLRSAGAPAQYEIRDSAGASVIPLGTSYGMAEIVEVLPGPVNLSTGTFVVTLESDGVVAGQPALPVNGTIRWWNGVAGSGARVQVEEFNLFLIRGSLALTNIAAAVWAYITRTLTVAPGNLTTISTTGPTTLDWEVPIGCTVDFDIVVPDVDGVPQDITTWAIYCTAKERFSVLDGGAGQLFQLTVGSGITKDPLGQNELNKFRVVIASALTKNLPFTEKQYELDIKISIPGSPNDPRLLGKGALTVTPTVTRAGTP